MIKEFGIKEAKEASKFAISDEQRKTVLATMAMMGLKNVISKQIVKAGNKAVAKIGICKTKVKTLHRKLDNVKGKESVQLDRLTEVSAIGIDWAGGEI